MPQKPYFPLGTLREVMLYPEGSRSASTTRMLRDALHKVGLDHLRGRLDEEERWDHILSGGEQQRVAFARVLIQQAGTGCSWTRRPRRSTRPGQANVMRLLVEELPETAVVSIGHRPGLEAFHTRELVLEPGEEGAQLRAASPASAACATSIAGWRPPAGPSPPARASGPAFRRTFIGR